MAALKEAPFVATVVWLGRVRDRKASLRAEAVEALRFSLEGPEGEAHAGLTRPACSRVAALHPRGTPIRNSRQVTILSEEELAATAAAMGIPGIDPALVGATMVVRGIPDFTLLPPSSRLQGPDGATLVIDLENLPCALPGREIEALHPGLGARYRRAAKGRRGVTAAVERAGRIALGDPLRLFIPAQRPWPHLTPPRG